MTLKNAFEELAVESEQEAQTQILRSILERLGFLDPVTFAQRVMVANTPSVTVSLIGGFQANADQYVQMSIPYANLRSRIVVT